MSKKIRKTCRHLDAQSNPYNDSIQNSNEEKCFFQNWYSIIGTEKRESSTVQSRFSESEMGGLNCRLQKSRRLEDKYTNTNCADLKKSWKNTLLSLQNKQNTKMLQYRCFGAYISLMGKTVPLKLGQVAILSRPVTQRRSECACCRLGIRIPLIFTPRNVISFVRLNCISWYLAHLWWSNFRFFCMIS